MKTILILVWSAAICCLSPRAATAAPRVARASSVSAVAREATDIGPLARDEMHRIVVGLELRDRAGLEAFLADVQDPASPSYQQFLTQDEFNARFAPGRRTSRRSSRISRRTASGHRRSPIGCWSGAAEASRRSSVPSASRCTPCVPGAQALRGDGEPVLPVSDRRA